MPKEIKVEEIEKSCVDCFHCAICSFRFGMEAFLFKQTPNKFMNKRLFDDIKAGYFKTSANLCNFYKKEVKQGA